MNRIVAFLRAVSPGWWDLHVYGGIAAVTYGIGSVWTPGGYIAFGLMISGLGLWFHARGS